MIDDATERISPHGYSVTIDEKRYLRCLCDGPKDAHEIADTLAADPVGLEGPPLGKGRRSNLYHIKTRP